MTWIQRKSHRFGQGAHVDWGKIEQDPAGLVLTWWARYLVQKMHGHPKPQFFPLMGTVPSTKYCWAPGSFDLMGTVPSTINAWAPKTPGFFPWWAPYPVLNTAGHLDPAPPSKFCPSPWDTGHTAWPVPYLWHAKISLSPLFLVKIHIERIASNS